MIFTLIIIHYMIEVSCTGALIWQYIQFVGPLISGGSIAICYATLLCISCIHDAFVCIQDALTISHPLI